MKEWLKILTANFVLLTVLVLLIFAADITGVLEKNHYTQVEQLQAEVQQLQADNKKLIERVDANDEYINHQLLMEGGR